MIWYFLGGIALLSLIFAGRIFFDPASIGLPTTDQKELRRRRVIGGGGMLIISCLSGTMAVVGVEFDPLGSQMANQLLELGLGCLLALGLVLTVLTWVVAIVSVRARRRASREDS